MAETAVARAALYETLFDELDRAGASGLAMDLVLGAFDGAEELDRVLGGSSSPRGEPVRARPAAGAVPAVFLKSITARGFRGVGPSATLPLHPAPGLTLVTGRNGSGKSSFAEAAELALTGKNERVLRGSVWRDGWRNLHAVEPPRVELELTVEGSARPLTVVRAWSGPDDDLDAATATVRTLGQSPRPLTDLPWQHALDVCRPFLAYAELSGLVTGSSSKVFDALDPILGLDDLSRTDDRLRFARKDLDDWFKTVKKQRDDLLAALAASGDPRAAAVASAIASPMWKRWDLDGARAAALAAADAPGSPASSGVPDDGEIGRARRLAELTVPSPDDVAHRARELRTAAARVADLAGTPADEARRLAALLNAGLHHHRGHGDGPCPLCGTGMLDAAWYGSAVIEVERLTALADDASAAHDALRRAISAGHTLVTDPPDVLDPPSEDGVRAAWREWSDLLPITEPERLADELERRYPPLAAASEAVRKAARDRLDTIDAAWNPLARRVLDWVDAARVGCAQQPLSAGLEAARGFMKTTIERMRDERLAPFAEQQAAIWSELRQESNVDLGPVHLRGTSTRRRLVVDVTVDGVDGAALGVMSQGELHALGLALFLPRATVPESPFRFVVIDDPVQAMDPAKVDGLARVLLTVAKTRQIVVFTHDDRLADAVRRFSPRDASTRFLEVVRRERSVVEIRPVDDPARRCLEEAWALAVTADLPDDIKRALVPAFCKTAVDAVCTDVFRRRRLAAGARHHDVEDLVVKAQRTAAKAALALFDDGTKQTGDVVGRINRKWGRAVGDTFIAVSGSGHDGYSGDFKALVKDTQRLVARLGEIA
jgi:energy-coupling factor transporter ATP-binding protein EcfA2/RNA polymerase subunit RPABC4/transcription elongation factor Spt4